VTLADHKLLDSCDCSSPSPRLARHTTDTQRDFLSHYPPLFYFRVLLLTHSYCSSAHTAHRHPNLQHSGIYDASVGCGLGEVVGWRFGVSPLRVGQEAYWLDQIARDRCEYYSGKGESPGWWAGSLAARTGLTGVAEEAAVRRLFAGQDPQTGEQRILPLWRTDPRSRLDARPLQAALRERAASRGVEVSELATGERLRNQLQRIAGCRKLSVVVVERVCRTVLDRNPEELYGDAYVEARKHVDKRIDARVASFDLSFSDPKSVSLLAAGSSPEVRAEVQAARHTAIRKVLGWLEQEAVGVRRGHNGIDRYRGSGSPRPRSIIGPAARATPSGIPTCWSRTPLLAPMAAGRRWTLGSSMPTP
jgi:TrwC relaxase